MVHEQCLIKRSCDRLFISLVLTVLYDSNVCSFEEELYILGFEMNISKFDSCFSTK